MNVHDVGDISTYTGRPRPTHITLPGHAFLCAKRISLEPHSTRACGRTQVGRACDDHKSVETTALALTILYKFSGCLPNDSSDALWAPEVGPL